MKRGALALYAAAHFWVDFSCALLLLGRLELDLSAFLFYNFCAFALQMPLGLLADRLCGARWMAALGCALAALAWCFGGVPAAVAAGVGNALFHVGGGVYALNSAEGCANLGVFVSPGALGIFLGGAAALPGTVAWVGLLLLGGAILRWGRGAPTPPFTPAPVGGRSALLPLVCLFLVVVLRSLMGGLFQFPWRASLGLALAIAVACGKAAGGILADRFGRRTVALASLALAAVGFVFSNVPIVGLAAVFAFQMTMPLTLWGAARYLRGAKGFAFGLLTLALFLGALPGLMGLPLPGGHGWLYALGAAMSVPLMLLGLGREESYD